MSNPFITVASFIIGLMAGAIFGEFFAGNPHPFTVYGGIVGLILPTIVKIATNLDDYIPEMDE